MMFAYLIKRSIIFDTRLIYLASIADEGTRIARKRDRIYRSLLAAALDFIVFYANASLD